MDRRQFLKWGSFVTVTAATTGLAGCGGDDDNTPTTPTTPPATDPGAGFTFQQGVASGDPKPDSVMLWTRVNGNNGGKAVNVQLQVSAQADFSALIVNSTLSALPDWDYTLRNKVTGLAASTTYYYRFIVGGQTSPVGRTKTAPAAGTPLSQLKFAFITCQDWSVNHWAGMEELVNEDLDFVVHMGDYIYETVGAAFQTGKVESRHAQLTLPDGTPRDDGARYATTINDYRYLYKSYRSDARLQALHARFPVIAIWDDHEFSDDCWQDRQTYSATDDATPRTARRRAANQAWFEFMPADVSFNQADTSFQNIQIYRSFTFGNLATLVMTDERLYRADHVIPEQAAGSEIGSRYFVPKATLAGLEAQKIAGASGALTPVSILGDTQRNWWQQQMGGATTTWKLWGNEVSMLRMQIDGALAVGSLLAAGIIAAIPALASQQTNLIGAIAADLTTAKGNGTYSAPAFATLRGLLASLTVPSPQIDALVTQLTAALPPQMLIDKFILNADQWDGYNAERKAMMAFLKSQNIGNVVALTGDIHAFFAGPVMDDYDAPSPAPVMVDLVTAGLSSNSFQSYFKSVVDSDPAFTAAAPLVYTTQNGAVVNTFNSTLTTFNPWLRYVDTDAQGYAVVTLTAAKLSCSFHKLKTIANGTAPAQPATASVKVVEVVAGTPAVNVL